jgi:hypothetical protein
MTSSINNLLDRKPPFDGANIGLLAAEKHSTHLATVFAVVL